MASSMGSVSITTSVTQIVANNPNRRAVFIKSLKANTATVFLKFDDSATVLSAVNGYPLEPGESITIVNNRFTTRIGLTPTGIEYWCPISGIVASGTADIRFSEMT